MHIDSPSTAGRRARLAASQYTLLLWLVLLLAGVAAPRLVTATPPIACPPAQPPLPPPPGCTPEEGPRPAKICARLEAARSSAEADVQTGPLVAYTLTLMNQGRPGAYALQVTLPFDPGLQRLVQPRFANAQGWVSAVTTDTLHLGLGDLHQGQTLTTTLIFALQSGATTSMPATMRARISWRGQEAGFTTQSNTIRVAAGATGLTLLPPELGVRSQEGSQLVELVFAGFAARDPVAIWSTAPNGATIPLGDVLADTDGSARLVVDPAALPPGRHQVVGYGACSQVSVLRIVEFRL